jgi:type VI secretion system protein ImpF
MARTSTESGAVVSVLDRLIDLEPTNTKEVAMSRAQSVRVVKASVRRDLEAMLNTRRIAVEPPAALRELNRSLYLYGLPDLSSFSLAAPADRQRLLRLLQTTIRLFEPRLTNVRVIPTADDTLNRHTLAFRIEGVLMMRPNPEQVSFDTVLELTSGQYQVKGEANAG